MAQHIFKEGCPISGDTVCVLRLTKMKTPAGRTPGLKE